MPLNTAPANPAGETPAYRLHPLSEGFVWQDRPPTDFRSLTEQQRAAFNEQGFVKLEGVFDAATLAAVDAAIAPFEASHEDDLRRARAAAPAGVDVVGISSPDVITFTTHIAQHSPVLAAFAAHPAIKAVCHDLMGDDVRLYWDQSVYKKTGKAQEFPWHQDNGYTFIEPQQYLTFWIPLVDVDEQNGCPWIAPGMHRLGTLKHWVTEIGLKCLDEVPDAVAVPAKAGDVILFSSLAPHRTGPNLRTGTVRKAYILQYCLDGSVSTLRDGTRIPQDDPNRQFKILEGGR
jgi:ectoine hydroxylase-related dioxygenase (phytanoyl-CoA dioxygenase family)